MRKSQCCSYRNKGWREWSNALWKIKCGLPLSVCYYSRYVFIYRSFVRKCFLATKKLKGWFFFLTEPEVEGSGRRKPTRFFHRDRDRLVGWPVSWLERPMFPWNIPCRSVRDKSLELCALCLNRHFSRGICVNQPQHEISLSESLWKMCTKRQKHPIWFNFTIICSEKANVGKPDLSLKLL